MDLNERYKITIVQRMDGSWTGIISGPHTHQEALGLIDMFKSLILKEAIEKALPKMKEGLRVS